MFLINLYGPIPNLSPTFLDAELTIMLLLSLSALVAFLTRYLIKIPYTVALVVMGLFLTLVPSPLNFEEFSSDLILAILVPPLIFEASMSITWPKLRENLGPILLLAVVGLLAGTFLISQIVHHFLGIPLAAAVAFGALISATDPVAVIAFFRTLGVSKKLALLVEGESLFNDGTAIVVFNLALAAGAVTATTHGAAEATGWLPAIVEFIQVAFGGVGIGILFGAIVSYIILKNIDDHLVETAITLALCYGSFAIAEKLHVSGILAIVTSGIFVATIGVENTSATTKITMDKFWEFLSYLVNSLLFLLIGLKINIIQLIEHWAEIMIALIAVLITRAIVVYGLTWLHEQFSRKPAVPKPYRHVMFWGGLRGAISLALALTLTKNSFGPGVGETIQLMTFGVVLFTLLVQGTTIERLINYFHLADKPEYLLEHQKRQAILYAKRAGLSEIDRLYKRGALAPQLFDALNSIYREEIEIKEQEVITHLQTYAELKQSMILQARGATLEAERAALRDANSRGLLNDHVYEELIQKLESQTAALQLVVDYTNQHSE